MRQVSVWKGIMKKMKRKKLSGLRKSGIVLLSVLVFGAGSVCVHAESGAATESPLSKISMAGNDHSGSMEKYRAIEIPDETAEEWQKEERYQYSSGEIDEEIQSFLGYGSDYGYEDMAKRSNSEGRQYLYQKLEEGCSSFTAGVQDAAAKTLWGETFYTAFVIDVSDYNLTADEKVEAYYTFRNDNPQYFWLSNQILYSDQTVTVLIYDAYREGKVRQEALNEILETVQSVYQSQIEASDSRYEKVLKIHDALIRDISYSEDTSRETAHSIAGALTSEKSAVCEGYTKVMQLMMNCYDIPNIYVTGYAGGGHAWNMVYMNDGKWYWLDATWDDQAYEDFQHTYFLVGSNNFTDHVADAPENTGTDFLYELPLVSVEDYVYDPDAVIMVKGDINEDGRINIVDLMMCLHHVSGRTLLDGKMLLAADINDDGRANIVDLMRMLHYVSGRNSKL